jgi:DNA-directed RNA polymerase specialized sigma24 family protein
MEAGDEGAHDPGGAGVSTLLRREERDAIRDCMDRLDAIARATCWLVFVEGCSKREAGRLLDRPEATVRAAIVAALASLRQCLRAKGLSTEGFRR